LPHCASFLFDDTRFSVDLAGRARVLARPDLVTGDIHKLGDAGWMQTGDVLKGFWTRAVTSSPMRHRQPAIAF
jgi:hypothetical protein